MAILLRHIQSSQFYTDAESVGARVKGRGVHLGHGGRSSQRQDIGLTWAFVESSRHSSKGRVPVLTRYGDQLGQLVLYA